MAVAGADTRFHEHIKLTTLKQKKKGQKVQKKSATATAGKGGEALFARKDDPKGWRARGEKKCIQRRYSDGNERTSDVDSFGEFNDPKRS